MRGWELDSRMWPGGKARQPDLPENEIDAARGKLIYMAGLAGPGPFWSICLTLPCVLLVPVFTECLVNRIETIAIKCHCIHPGC